jgi:transposase
MYVTSIPNRGSKPATLLRESYREGGKVKSRTVANLSKLPAHAVDALRRSLRGETLVGAREAFSVTRSVHHGHVEAVLTAMKRLGVAELISARPSRERDLAMGMIAGRILAPGSKLQLTREWETTSLPSILGLSDANENELYGAMDWLLTQQPSVQAKLAKKHLEPCALMLYDLTSTWYEGAHCPLAKRGYSRDERPGSLQINFGLLTDERGCPIAVSVYDGSTADSKTVMDQVSRAREEFGIDLVVLVGDRGMITQAHIESFKDRGGVEWITALRTSGIRKLADGGQLQLDLFDEKNLFEITSPEFPGERLVACRNPALARRRAATRQDLLEATKVLLEKVKASIEAGRLQDKAAIALRVGRIINKHKVAKHFKVTIEDGSLSYEVDSAKVEAEAALDGIYVIRTSIPKEVMSASDAVRNYKCLSRVERAFRATKTIDLHVRPIFHRTEERVRAHIFLCMLAYYVEWHMRQAWAPLLFADDSPPVREDPVLPARRSESAERKASTKIAADGHRAHSFASLLQDLSTIVRNVCQRAGAPDGEATFEITTAPSALQQCALALLTTIKPARP